MKIKDCLMLMYGVVAVSALIGVAWLLMSDSSNLDSEDVSTTIGILRQEELVVTNVNLSTSSDLTRHEPGAADRVGIRSKIALPEPTSLDDLELSDGMSAIRGVVYDSSNTPITGASVELLKGSSSWAERDELHESVGIHDASDASGAFVLRDTPLGKDYLVKVSHPFWTQKIVGPVEVRAGEVTLVSPVFLERASKVYGQVTDSTGLPLAGAEITLTSQVVRLVSNFNRAPAKPWKAVLADEMGEYEVGSFDFRDYSIAVRAEGYASHTKTFAGALDSTSEREVNFELGPACALNGWVRTPEGEAISGAIVVAQPIRNGMTIPRRIESDESGAFRFVDLAEGSYVLNTEKPGFVSLSERHARAGTQDHILTMHRQGSIEGQAIDSLTGKPVTRFQLTLMRHREGSEPIRTGIQETFDDPSGHFSISNVEPDIYCVFVRAEGYAVAQSGAVMVSRGSSVSELTVVCDKGGKVQGKVTDSEGRAVSHALVELRVNYGTHNVLSDVLGDLVKDVTDPDQTVRSNEDGSYALELVEDGIYQVRVTHLNYSPAVINNVSVVSGYTTSAPAMALTSGGSIEGVAYNGDGDPLIGARITASTKEGAAFSSMTDPTGQYSIEHLLPGSYKLAIREWPTQGEALHPLLKAALISKSTKRVKVEELQTTRTDLKLTSTQK